MNLKHMLDCHANTLLIVTSIMVNSEPPPFGKTAGDFVEFLKGVPPDTELYIEGFTFYRWKWRGKNLLALELDAVEQEPPTEMAE